jgi:hypothetical protein
MSDTVVEDGSKVAVSETAAHKPKESLAQPAKDLKPFEVKAPVIDPKAEQTKISSVREDLKEITTPEDDAETSKLKKQRVKDMLNSLERQKSEGKAEKHFPITGMLGDSDKIEGHQIDFIGQTYSTIVDLKVTAQMNERLHKEIIPNLPNIMSFS